MSEYRCLLPCLYDDEPLTRVFRWVQLEGVVQFDAIRAIIKDLGVKSLTWSRDNVWQHDARYGSTHNGSTPLTVVEDLTARYVANTKKTRVIRTWIWRGPTVEDYCTKLSTDQWDEAFAFWEAALLSAEVHPQAEKWLAALTACGRGTMPTANNAAELALLEKRANERAEAAARRKENRRQRKEMEKEYMIRQVKAGRL